MVLDHSALSLLLDCPRAWFHKYIEGIEPKGTALRLVAGSAMHKGLAVLYGSGLIEDAVQALAEEYGQQQPFGDLDFLTIGHLETVLRNYYDRWVGQDPFEVVSLIEEPIVESIDGLQIGGIPDMVVEEGGELVVVDHKTTTSFLGSHLYNRVKFTKQMPIYCLLLTEKLGRPVRRAIVNAIYTGKYAASEKSKAAKFERWSFEYSEEDLEETKWWLRNTIEDSDDLRRRVEPEERFFTQHGGSHCGWCEFKSLCEVPPPLRGGIKSANFQKRELTGILLSGADS